MMPFAVVTGGEGPTALPTGATHGDDGEGPLAIQRLLAELDPARVRGRMLAFPCLNLPAFRTGRQVSLIDGVKLNRAVPGDPRGTVTQQIAADVARELVPQADPVHVAPEAGLLEPQVDLGATVAAGQPLARLRAADRTGAAPVTPAAHRAGLFVARHAPGLIQPGDCRTVLAVPGD